MKHGKKVRMLPKNGFTSPELQFHSSRMVQYIAGHSAGPKGREVQLLTQLKTTGSPQGTVAAAGMGTTDRKAEGRGGKAALWM